MPDAAGRDEPALRVRVIGDDLLSFSVADAQTAQSIARQLRANGGWCEVVAGIDSVVVQFDNADDGIDAASARYAAQLRNCTPAALTAGKLFDIPVCYGGDVGPDLDCVCEQLGLGREELIARHTAGEHRVEMLGFTPGFAYVGSLDDRFDVPRRGQPRARVAAGSVGVAGGLTGLYALPGPGGWSVIGRTPVALFDAAAGDAFLLQPGARIRFRQIDRAEFRRLAKS